jgi:hypothetical protein
MGNAYAVNLGYAAPSNFAATAAGCVAKWLETCVHFPRREVYGAVDLGSPTAVRERASRGDELRTLVGPQCKAVLKFVRQEAREVPIVA